MEAKTYTTIDRAALGWPTGQWDGEPDKVQWSDEATGLPCLAVRNCRAGNWCGYVGLPPKHPMYGKGCIDDGVDFDVHGGGLTFAGKRKTCESEAQGICHTTCNCEPDDVWWLGFHCAHACDFSPLDKKYEVERGYPFTIMEYEQYRTLDYVQQQCAELAAQVEHVAFGGA